jgi:hypothetical protein
MPNTAKVLTDVRLFTGGADLTSANNKVELAAEVEEKDATVFRSSGTGQMFTSVIGGLAQASIDAEGLWSAGADDTVDPNLWAGLGGVGAWTVYPDTADVDDVAYLTSALQADYQLLGKVGDVAPWKATARSSWPLARGKGAHPPGTARTATGDGTPVEHVAVPAGSYLYANLHVLSIAGTSTPTLTVKVQSDDGVGFASPTDRITFDAATAVGGQSKRVAGAITDTWYRATWTISGTNPSFLFAVAFGVAV